MCRMFHCKNKDGIVIWAQMAKTQLYVHGEHVYAYLCSKDVTKANS